MTLAGRRHGWTLDNLLDLPRVLRPAGTVNHKYTTLVTLLANNGLRYDPGDFDARLSQVPPRPQRRATGEGDAIDGLPDLRTVAESYGTTFTEKSAEELAGAHPLHGSSTGNNFNVNPGKQVWHCWRCDSGGGVLQLVAVCEGLIGCEQAKPGALAGKRFVEVVKLCNSKFGTTIPLRDRQRWREEQARNWQKNTRTTTGTPAWYTSATTRTEEDASWLRN
jgi:hypothetical protein